MPSGRAERSDARANRERLLREAELLFGEAGVDASLHELVARAGLGIGTLYRHFPRYDDLIRALYDRIVERLDEIALRAEVAGSGWAAVMLFLDETLAMFIEYPAGPAIMQRMSEIDPGYRPGTRYEEPMLRYVAQAQAEGILRPDVAATDIGLLPYLLSSVLRMPEPARGVMLARFRALLIDGLRAHPAEGGELPWLPIGVDDLHAATHHQDPTAQNVSPPS